MTDIDLKKTLLQHLESLRWSGLGDLPTDGELDFDFSQLEMVDVDETSGDVAVAPSISSTPKADPSEKRAAVPSAQAPSEPYRQVNPVAAETPVVSQPSLLATGSYGDVITDVSDRNDVLAVIANEVTGCTKCTELCRTRINTVFGVGPADAKIVFLGEGPGANEDQQGEPFVGAAGQLLDKILMASQLKRQQVYIVNVVKCRPPGNRNPADSEIQNCWNYLERQLDIIQPTHIVCLGSVAAKSLLNTKQSLGKLRKTFHAYRDSKVIVTYHPAYLLRTPSAKKHVWEDMKMLMSEFGVEL